MQICQIYFHRGLRRSATICVKCARWSRSKFWSGSLRYQKFCFRFQSLVCLSQLVVFLSVGRGHIFGNLVCLVERARNIYIYVNMFFFFLNTYNSLEKVTWSHFKFFYSLFKKFLKHHPKIIWKSDGSGEIC